MWKGKALEGHLYKRLLLALCSLLSILLSLYDLVA